MGPKQLEEWRCQHCQRERPPLLALVTIVPGLDQKAKCRQCKQWSRLTVPPLVGVIVAATSTRAA